MLWEGRLHPSLGDVADGSAVPWRRWPAVQRWLSRLAAVLWGFHVPASRSESQPP